MVLPALCLLLVIPTAWAHALSPHDSGYEHGLSDANKLIQGRVNDMYILQPKKTHRATCMLSNIFSTTGSG